MSSASRKLIQASGGGGPADTGDDDFANVVLLLDGDGTSGDDNNTFTDSSTNGFTVTETGSVVQGSFSPYGDNWSNYFDSNYLYASSSANFNLSSGNWTIEGWLYTIDTSYGERYVVLEGSSQNFGLIRGNNNTVEWNFFGTSALIVSSTNSVLPNTWVHFAVVSNSGTITLYVDGVSQGTTTTYPQNSNTQVTLAASVLRYTSISTNTYISNLRIVKGTAIYTSAFTPPTDPLTAVTNTQLLTCSSNRFADESTNNSTITISGTPKVTPFSPFKDDDARDITTDGGSAYFNLSLLTSYLTYSGGSSSVSDITISFWVYVTGSMQANGGLYPRIFASGSAQLLIYTRGDDIRIYNGGEKLQTPIIQNEWHHFVAQRTSNTWEMWLDGDSKGTASDSTAVNLNSTNYIGRDATAAGYFGGYISDFKITEGSEGYSGSFTPPSSPVSAGSSDLLLNFQDSGIYDRTGLSNLDTVGNAQIDTAVKKYGTGSLQFDGTNDYLLIDYQTEDFWNLSNTDFTIEFWAYASSLGSFNGVVSSWEPTTAWLIESVGSDMRFYTNYSGSTSYISMGSISTGAWNHWAVTREGTTLRTFKNGTLVTSTTQSAMTTNTNPLIVGAVWEASTSSSGQWNGYVDDLRITKGIARYTSSFTAPDAELPKF